MTTSKTSRTPRATSVRDPHTPAARLDTTPNPAAVAQLTPTPELLAELEAAVPAQRCVTDEPELALPPLDAEARTELADVMAGRAGTYALLARLYRTEMDAGLLERLRDTRFPARSGNDDTDAGYRLIATYLSNVWEDSLVELAKDYVRAFVGHTGEHIAAAYPFESAYTSEKRLLMQEARDEVLALYRAAGLKKRDTWRDGEDHIALELEYMQALAQRCVALLRADDDGAEADSENVDHVDMPNASTNMRGVELLLRAQHNFLEDHLARWVPAFTRDVETYAMTDFYRGVARLTRGFVETDGEFTRETFGLDDPSKVEAHEAQLGARDNPET